MSIEKEFTDIEKALHIGNVRRGFFGVKYFYIDKRTRVRYGFSLYKIGVTYELQRKGFFWSGFAWTYATTHNKYKIEGIIDYLYWYESTEKKRSSRKCVF